MRKIIAAIIMTGLVGHAFAQTQPRANQDRDDRAAVVPGTTGATAAATGNLTPLYIGAGLIAAAAIAGSMSGDGHCDHTPGGGGTGGTTGTTGTTGTM